MTDVNELDCKVYLATELSRDDIASRVAESLGGTLSIGPAGGTVHTGLGEIELRQNEDFTSDGSRQYPDGFLFFPWVLEFYPFPATRHAERVTLVERVLNLFWSQGLPAVAACDFESELSHGGGYDSPSLPWPSGAAETVESSRSA